MHGHLLVGPQARMMRFDTKLVVVGSEPDAIGSLVPPIHVAVTYEQRAQDELRYFYGRGENPTRETLERCLASLEDAAFATAFGSGQAAGASVLSLVEPGSRVVVSDDVYGGTYALLSTLERYGVTVEYADLSEPAVVLEVLGEDVGLVWIETPTNPLLKVADIAAVCAEARRHGALVLVDNTFASPALQQPLTHGADITLYSTTKSIAGHSDVIGGAVVTNSQDINQRVRAHRFAVGGVPGAIDCFLVHRGLKTLSLRIDRQVATTRRIVAALEQSDAVGVVHYPGLATHPNAAVTARQMRAPGAIVSFQFLGDPQELLRRTRIFACAVSLGSVRSLIESPASMTHRPIPAEVRRRLGIDDDLIRLSIGIEDPEDLLDDLDTALAGRSAAPLNRPAPIVRSLP